MLVRVYTQHILTKNADYFLHQSTSIPDILVLAHFTSQLDNRELAGNDCGFSVGSHASDSLLLSVIISSGVLTGGSSFSTQ